MNWAERCKLISKELDERIERMSYTSDKDYIVSLAYLAEVLGNAEDKARFDHENDAMRNSLREIRELAHELPDSLVIAEGTPMAPHIKAIINTGQRIKLEAERLDRLDV